MTILPNIFKPKFNYDLIRLGSNYDGGYLVERTSILKTQYLYSFGISTNWDFEQDFININNVNIYAFDGSISLDYWNKLIFQKFIKGSLSKAIKLIIQKKRFFKFFNDKNFYSKYVGKSFSNSLSLNEILIGNYNKNLFFKIDIEGSEYEILDEIIFFQEQIIGLCIEFHFCNDNIKYIINFIKKLNMEIVHVHANNYLIPDHNSLPEVLEITFAKEPLQIGQFKGLPHSLDMPNKSKGEEIIIKFEE